jgi:hypothetical protein
VVTRGGERLRPGQTVNILNAGSGDKNNKRNSEIGNKTSSKEAGNSNGK